MNKMDPKFRLRKVCQINKKIRRQNRRIRNKYPNVVLDERLYAYSLPEIWNLIYVGDSKDERREAHKTVMLIIAYKCETMDTWMDNLNRITAPDSPFTKTKLHAELTLRFLLWTQCYGRALHLMPQILNFL